jgi:steroid delta-isomerase-like uncharacterized protein
MATEQKISSSTGGARSSTPETNKEIVRQLYAAFNSGEIDRAAALVTDDVEVTTVAFGTVDRGKNAYKTWLSNWKNAMPDCTLTLKHQCASGDQVYSEFHAVGTHRGTLRTPNGDLKPTGKKLELDVVEAWDVRDGKLSRLRAYFDGLNMMRTFGAIK